MYYLFRLRATKTLFVTQVWWENDNAVYSGVVTNCTYDKVPH